MRRSVPVLLSLFFLFASDILAQTEKTTQSTSTSSGVDRLPKRKDYNTWEVGLHGGLTYPNTDIAASDLNRGELKSRMAFGLNLSKFFSHSFALQAQLIHARLE